MVTTEVTGWAKVTVLPRWSVMLMGPAVAEPVPLAVGDAAGGGVDGSASGEEGCGSARR